MVDPPKFKLEPLSYKLSDKLSERSKELGNPMRISAPMVRYSKLPFRELLRLYSTEICYTPMMLSDSFTKSQKYRDLEYSVPPTYSTIDRPVIAQFAATDPVEFAQSALLVYSRGASGIDLNCGCPQRWAWQEGIGCKTTARKDWPEFIHDCVRMSKNLLPDNNFTISIKTRMLAENDRKGNDVDFNDTLTMLQNGEKAGVDFIGVHARTRHERNCEPHYEDAKKLVDLLEVPTIINGGFKSRKSCLKLFEDTPVAGLMVAQKILEDPDFWSENEVKRSEVVKNWYEISINRQVDFKIFLHHLLFMLDKPYLDSEERDKMAKFTSFSEVTDYLYRSFRKKSFQTVSQASVV